MNLKDSPHSRLEFNKSAVPNIWLLRAIGLMTLLVLFLGPQAWAKPAACPALLDHTFPRLQDDTPQHLCQYQGNVILIVNTASFCGFTQQYEGLEKLYSRYKDRGLIVLGFPSNDFGNQEPGSNKEIAEFCSGTFGVKFPMVAKTSVKGSKANPLFKQLARQSEFPGWNFHKYIIGRDGKLVRSFSSQVPPSDRQMISEIERALSVPRS
jgi:glutathione peroxidase